MSESFFLQINKYLLITYFQDCLNLCSSIGQTLSGWNIIFCILINSHALPENVNASILAVIRGKPDSLFFIPYIISVGHPTRYYLPTVCILGMHVLVATSCLILRNILILCSHAPHCCCLRPAYGYE